MASDWRETMKEDVLYWSEDITWTGPNGEVVHLVPGEELGSFTTNGAIDFGHNGTATHSSDGSKL